jgi:hypothetical protein
MDYHALEKMTVQMLRDEAKKYPEIGAVAGLKKSELIDMIAENLGIEKPHRVHKKSKHHFALDKAGIKNRIAELREAKKATREKKDHKQTAILRRRIHVLKRRISKID